MSTYEPVIGLEIHIQLKTKSKMFCSSPNNPDVAEPNTNICEICTGQPGTLPVLNQNALEKAILLGLALNCKIAEYSKFDRKNYFYPDLPKGYQISQFDKPVCGKGQVTVTIDGKERNIGITRAHLEEDAGKLLHPAGAKHSLVDLNRAGTPLLEIVTEPDFESPQQARVFLQNLRTLTRYLGASDADMEKGHMRCDANISLRKKREKKLPNYKVEIKNMNSFKAVEDALTYEIRRQEEELEDGKKIPNQTRGWVDNKKITVEQRIKEGSDDYRYFPEPDLPVLHITREMVEKIRGRMPELPAKKLERFVSEYSLPQKIADQLVADKDMAGYFEGVVSDLKEWMSAEKMDGTNLSKLVKEAANLCTGSFTELLNENSTTPSESKITAENFAELIKMVESGEVSKTAAKQVFAKMFTTGGDPSNIVEDLGLKQVSDTEELEKKVDEVLAANEKIVSDYKGGKKQALGALVGQVMKATRGQANPQVVNKILMEKLR